MKESKMLNIKNRTINDEALNDCLTIFKAFCNTFDIEYDKLNSHIVEVKESCANSTWVSLVVKLDNNNIAKFVFYYSSKRHNFEGHMSVYPQDQTYSEDEELGVKYEIDYLKNIIGIKTEKYYVNTEMIDKSHINNDIEYNIGDTKIHSKIIKQNIIINIPIVKKIDNIIKNKLIELGLDYTKTKGKWNFVDHKINKRTNWIYTKVKNNGLYIKINVVDGTVDGYKFTKKKYIAEDEFKIVYNLFK